MAPGGPWRQACELHDPLPYAVTLCMPLTNWDDLREQLASLPPVTYPLDESPEGAIAHSRQITTVAAICCEAFRRYGLKAVLVGGGVIEFMMPGAYTTPDIDLVVSRERLKPPRALVSDVFSAIGFHPSGARHWVRDGWFVEVPDFDITDPTMVVEVAGHKLTMVVPESILIARLVEYDQTGHTGHATQAFMMLSVLSEALDDAELTRMAKTEGVYDLLLAARAFLARPQHPMLTDSSLRHLRDSVRAQRYQSP